jgi:Response regulators consisting of a CheY-like receiver domain and a winged-helix DNA-binding domain
MTGPLTRILYVDDEPILQKVIRVTLEKMGGYTVEIAGSGNEALEKVSAFQPDLILLDVMMPGMDGPSTLEHLRRMPGIAHVPVVFITAKAQPQEIARFRAMGVADVLTKPFDPRQLCESLNAIWTRAGTGGTPA